MVFEMGKTTTLVCFRKGTAVSFVIEEIGMPSQEMKKQSPMWSEWIQAGAPGHTSWSMVEIDKETLEILECFSFPHSAWVKLSEKESLLSTLLSSSLKRASPAQQRKIGPPPLAGERDFRKIWTPPLIYEGKKVEALRFDAYQMNWPEDGSELAGKEVLLYLDREGRCPLPYWIELTTSHTSAAIRTIDAGAHLPAPHPDIPRRMPEFLGPAQKTEQRLLLPIKSPKYYKKFELYAIDLTQSAKQILSIPHQLQVGEGERKTLCIEIQTLSQILELNHRYQWLLVPVESSASYVKSTASFIWEL